jgi:hypothetical protein
MSLEYNYKWCSGPAIVAGEQKCLVNIKMHKIPNSGDGASYNGIKNWRCPTCFEEHRKLVREFNKN